MRKLLVLFVTFATAPLFAQATALTLSLAGPTIFKPAGTVVLNLALSGSSGANISGVQFTVPAPGGSTVVMAGAASTAASKQVTCNQAATGTLPLTCIAVGLNNATFSDGVVAVLTVTLPNPIVQGLTWTMPTIVASTVGAQVTATSAAPTNPCNITGSGTVGTADMTASISQALNAAVSCVDLTGDGVCNIFDVVRVVIAAQPSGVCKVGP